jgi:hypothetical protein
MSRGASWSLALLATWALDHHHLLLIHNLQLPPPAACTRAASTYFLWYEGQINQVSQGFKGLLAIVSIAFEGASTCFDV